MFVWTTVGKKVFRTIPKDLFEPTKALAANQGLYNGFLSAGLIWSLFITDPIWSKNTAIFFLACVIVAALYGDYTAANNFYQTRYSCDYCNGFSLVFELIIINTR